MMGFIEAHIEGERLYKGKVFPKTFVPSKKITSSDVDLAAMVMAESERITELLEEHGAVLFRGFGVGSAEEFSRVVEAFGNDEFTYQGPADRVRLAPRVYTTNSVPLDVFISFHHEMAMIKEFPQRIIFFCMQPPSEGGETSIIRSSVIVEKMEEELPEIVAEFSKDGIYFVLHTKAAAYKNNASTNFVGGTVWQRMLQTTDQVEGEKRAKAMLACDSIKFNDDGTADFRFGPMNPIREFNGKRVMFNRVLGYETGERDAFVTFKDGSPFPLKAQEAIEKMFNDNCVDIKWEKGDVMLVDNLAVQHARRPGKGPRKVMVSLSK